MKYTLSHMKLIVACTIIAILILISILYITSSTPEEKIEKVRLELISTYKANTELFKSVAKFIQNQEGDYLFVMTSTQTANGINVIYGDEYRDLDLNESSDIYISMNSIIHEYEFTRILKINHLIHFSKAGPNGLEQGIVFSPSGEKPEDGYIEPLEDNWYYYLDRLE